MKPGILVALCLTIACSVLCAAPVLDPASVTEMTLDNGMHVVVKQAPQWGVVSLAFVVKASPLYETEEQEGLSDLVRHMMFEVPFDDKASVSEDFADLGADLSTYTSLDGTQIKAGMSVQSLPALFPKLVKAVFEPTFDEEVWAKHSAELRRRMMDHERVVTTKLFKALWEKAYTAHSYGRSVSGTTMTVSTHNSQDLAEFHRNLYVPNNMSLIVVGDVDPKTVFDLAREYVQKYPRAELKLPTVTPEPAQTDIRVQLLKEPIRNTLLSFAWHGAGIADKRDVCTLDVIYAILSEGQTARLMKALVTGEQIDAVPEVEFITKRDPGLFIITCVSKPDAWADTRETVLAEIAKLRDETVGEDELANAKELIHAAYTFDNAAYDSQIGSLGFYELIDSYRFAINYLDEVSKVTAEDIQRVAKQYLGASNYTLVIASPRKDGGQVWEASLTQ